MIPLAQPTHNTLKQPNISPHAPHSNLHTHVQELGPHSSSDNRLVAQLWFVSQKMDLCVCYRFNTYEDLRWLYGDVITGLTVAIVNIPQALSYASVGVKTARFCSMNLSNGL